MSGMRTRTAVLIFTLALLFSTGASAADRTIHKTLPFDANGRLSLVTHNGTVTVTTSNQPRIDITARIEPARFGDDSDVGKVDVRISGSGNSVRVETNYDAINNHFSWLVDGNHELPPVHYTIALPPGGSVDIDDHNATVRVTGVQGDVTVNAHNGNIDLNGIGGAASVDAHNADVHVAFNRFARGSEIETHNGAIDVQMPATARFKVNARGHHLNVESDFPAVTREMDRDAFMGDVNGGGPELRITTHNGSVRLKRS